MHYSGFTSYFLFLTGLKIIVAEFNGVLETVSQDQAAVGLAEYSGVRYHRPTIYIGSSFRVEKPIKNCGQSSADSMV